MATSLKGKVLSYKDWEEEEKKRKKEEEERKAKLNENNYQTTLNIKTTDVMRNNAAQSAASSIQQKTSGTINKILKNDVTSIQDVVKKDKESGFLDYLFHGGAKIENEKAKTKNQYSEPRKTAQNFQIDQQSGNYTGNNLIMMSDEQLNAKKKSTQAAYEDALRNEEIFNDTARREEEQAKKRNQYNEATEKEGIYGTLQETGLRDDNYKDGPYFYKKRPDDYYDDQSYYDRLMYEYLHGVGSYDAIETREGKDKRDKELSDVWDAMDNGNIYNLRNEEMHKTTEAGLNYNGDFGSNKYKNQLADTEEELNRRNEIRRYENNAPDVDPTYDPSLVKTYQTKTNLLTQVFAPGVMPSEVQTGDEIDILYQKINNPYNPVGSDSIFGDKESQLKQLGTMDAAYFMTQEQADTFNKYYKAGMKQEAKAFYDALLPTLETIKMSARSELTQDMSKNEYAPLMIAERALMPEVAGALGTVGSVLAIAGNKDAQKQYSDWYAMQNAMGDIQTARQETWGDKFAEWFGEDARNMGERLAGVGYSITDNIRRALITKGASKMLGLPMDSAAAKTIDFGMLGADVMSNTMAEGLKEGYSPEESFVRACGESLIEVATENMWWDDLFSPDLKDLIGKPKDFVKYLGNVFMSEGMEEVSGNVMDTIFDEAVSKLYDHESELESKYHQLVDNGMDPEEAKRNVMGGWLEETGYAFLSGGLSALAMGSARGVSTRAELSGTGKAAIQSGLDIKNATSSERAAIEATNEFKIVEAAEKMGPETESAKIAKAIREDFRNGKKVSNARFGGLIHSIVNESGAKIGNIVQDVMGDTIEERLMQEGEKKAVAQKDARIVVNAIVNDDISSKVNLGLASDTAFRIYKEYVGSEEFDQAKDTLKTQVKGVMSAQDSIRELLTPASATVAANAYARLTDGAEDLVDKSRGVVDTLLSKDTSKTGEIVRDGKKLGITGIKITPVNQDGVTTNEIKLQLDDGTEADLGDVKTTNIATAKVLKLAESAGGKLVSEKFANALMKNANVKNTDGYLAEAMNLRFAAMLDRAMPKTGLDNRAAAELYNTSKEEFDEAEVKRIANRRVITPGQGKASLNGAVYGTGAFNSALDNLAKEKNLDKKVKNEILAASKIAKAAGFDVELYYDENDTANQGSFEGKNGIRINLAGTYNKEGVRRSALATLAHEVEHWLEANSPEEYKTFRKFALDNLEKSGLNLQHEVLGVMDNYAHYGENIDINGAVAEIVAKSAEQMFGNEKIVRELAKQEPTTFERVQAAVTRLVDRIRDAIGSVRNTSSRYAQTLMNVSDQMADLWLRTYEEAKGTKGTGTGTVKQSSRQENDPVIRTLNRNANLQIQTNNLDKRDILYKYGRRGYDVDGVMKESDLDAFEGFMDKKDLKRLREIEQDNAKWEQKKLDYEKLTAEDPDYRYVQAWQNDDFDEMENILREKIEGTDGVIPFKAPKSYQFRDKDIAKYIKEGNKEAINIAAAHMAQQVPKNAVLVPMPNHHGVVNDDTDTMMLARAISEMTGRPVVNALAGADRESRYDSKKNKGSKVTAADMGFRQIADLPEGTVPYFVDNVVGSGETAKAAHDAFGKGVTLSYAKSSRAGLEGLKNAGPTYYDKYQTRMIPLHDRIDMSKTFKTDGTEAWKYSMQENDESYRDAVDRGDMETAQRLVDERAEEAFRDSKARTDDGKLIKVFHGTNADFNVFDTRVSGGKNGTQEGYGIYLSDEKAITKQYGDRQISSYLNMKKPAYGFRKTMRRNELAKLIQATVEDQASKIIKEDESYSFNDALLDTWVSNYVNTRDYPSMRAVYADVASKIMEYNDNDADIIYELMEGMGIRDYESAMDFYHNILTPTTGIDGFWQKWDNRETGGKSNVFVAFDSSQIKKSDAVTYDDDGNVIPLSERFNEEKGDIRYSFAGTDPETGKSVYISNYAPNTEQRVKSERLINLVQNVWSKKPIKLTVEENGKKRVIYAKFDPDFDPTGARKTDLGKMAFPEFGPASRRRVAMNLVDDYYQILEESYFDGHLPEMKDHKDVTQWNYFVDDIYYADQDSDEAFPYQIAINIKEKSNGDFVYAYYPKKLKDGKSKKLSVMGMKPVNTGSKSGESASASKEIVSREQKSDKSQKSFQEDDATGKKLEKEYRDAYDRYTDLRLEFSKRKDEAKSWEKRIIAAPKDQLMALAEEYGRWEQESGYAKMREELEEAEKAYKEASKKWEEYAEQRDVAQEQGKIRDSGLSEADWRRKEAVKEYGYTTNYREAGYLLPNGKMLNFSGEKGKHPGHRGQDHRNIGTVYASWEMQGAKAMTAFMNDGNIRVMAETPGVDISTTTEPTTAQYNMIREMAYRFADDEYFTVDLSDANGNNVGNLEYEGKINPSRIVNDIRTYFRTGEVPQQSAVDRFRYSFQDDTDIDVAHWMQTVPETEMQTAAEKELLKQYKGKRIGMELQRERLRKIEEQLRQAQRTPEKERTEEDKRKIRKLEVMQENATRILNQREKELAEVTGDEGFGRMMYQQRKMLNDFIYGRTQGEVRDSVEAMEKSADEITRTIEENRQAVAEIENSGVVEKVKKILGSTTADQTAARLKKEFHSTWTKNEIRDHLDPILLKMAAGEDFTQDVEDLAGILINTDDRNSQIDDDLYMLRGLTIVIGPGQQRELKGQGGNIKTVRARLAGTGIKVKYGDYSTLEKDIDNLTSEYGYGIFGDMGDEKDSLENFLTRVEARRDDTIKGNGYAERLADTMATVMNLAASTADNIYLPADPKARNQVLELVEFVKSLKAKTDAAEKTLENVAKQLEGMQAAGAKASGLAGVLVRDVNVAIDYYNKVAQIAEDSAKVKKKEQIIEKLKSKHAQQILKNNEEWRNLIERDREARSVAEDNQKRRKKIDTDIKRLYKLLKEPKGTNNVPEHMQGLARWLIGTMVENDLTEGSRKITLTPKQNLEEAQRVLTAWKMRDGDFNIGDLADMDPDNYGWLNITQDIMYIDEGLEKYNSLINGKNKLDTLKQRGEILKGIQEAASEIYSYIRAENEIAMKDRKIAIEDAAYDVMTGTGGKKHREWTGKAGRALAGIHKMIVSGNMTPEYFFRTLGNEGLSNLWDNYHAAENRNGLELAKAKARLAEIAEKTGYKGWDTTEKKTVNLHSGDVQMTVGQLMSLYATWKREQQLGPEMSQHLTKGGFYAEQDLREGLLGRAEIEKRPHRVNEDDMEIVNKLLTKEQKQYVDDVVEFMSNDMSQLGNEASMAAYGIKMYKEGYYFPFQMWNGVKSRKSNEAAAGANVDQAFHPSFSKTRKHGANNAIILGDFTQTAADHIAGMINYATMGLANESLQKVLNYQVTEGMSELDQTKRNIRAMMEEAYGQEAMQYLDELQRQLNGGAVKTSKSFGDKAISLFRKNAVAGSLSVAAQQPLSYIRAAMMVNPKYLARALSPDMWKGNYKEMLEHSGVAVIKDMGRFDMNFGQSAREYLMPDEKQTTGQKIWEQVKDKTTILPELMDRMTWTRMWSAVKAEQAAQHPDMDVKSDEFLNMVGERFNDLMRRTQVYDSVLVKSANMRSDNFWTKSLTSFMAEPTLTMNVLADAVRQAAQKEKGGMATLAKAAATFMMSAAAQAAVKALFSTGRSPDKDKTWWENFLYRFGSNVISEMDPAQLVPGYSDLVELFKNGELQDDAMSAIGKLATAAQEGIDLITGKKSFGHRTLEDSAGQIVQLFTNVPLKNIMRDGRAMYNWFIGKPYADRETDASVLKYQLQDSLMNADNLIGVINKYLGEAGYQTTNKAYYQRIYDAKKEGREQDAQDMIDYLLNGKGVKEKTLTDKLRELAKGDEDLSATETADFMAGEGMNVHDYILNQVKQGNMDRKDAEKRLAAEDPSKTADEIWWSVDRAIYKRDTGKDPGGSSAYHWLKDAINENKSDKIKSAVKDLMDHGYDKEKIKKKLSDWKKDYLEATGKDKVALKNALIIAYKAIGISEAEANGIINKWK